jgi:hypothetical protein
MAPPAARDTHVDCTCSVADTRRRTSAVEAGVDSTPLVAGMRPRASEAAGAPVAATPGAAATRAAATAAGRNIAVSLCLFCAAMMGAKNPALTH